MKLPAKGQGFTLPELITTVAIAAIAISIAVPTFENVIIANKADQTRNDLFALFRFARAEAINRQSVVAVCPLQTSGNCDSNWNGQIGVFEDSNSNGQRDPQEELVRVIPLELDDWHISKLPASRPHFQWNALGTANGTAGSVTLCRPNWHQGGRAIVVSFAGRIRTSLDFDGNGIEERSPGAEISC